MQNMTVAPHCTRCGNRMQPEEGCFRCPSCSTTYCDMAYPEHQYGIDGHPDKPEPATPHPSEEDRANTEEIAEPGT